MRIANINAWQIYDSRGNPTLEAEVILENGCRGHGLVPSGASMEDTQWIWLQWKDGNIEHYQPPAIGETQHF